MSGMRPHRFGRAVPLWAALVVGGLILALLVLVLWQRPASAQDAVDPDPVDQDITDPNPVEQAGGQAAETQPTAESEPGGGAEPATNPNPDNGGDGPDPVPCEVAMVVGCVATVEGENGPSTVTLQVANAAQQVVQTASRSLDELAADEERPDDRPLQSGLDPWERGGLQANFGTDAIPISQYQIGADVTGWLGVPDPLDSFVASQTNWAFTTATFLVILATNALDWAFEFPLAESLIGDAGVLAQTYSIEYFGFGLSTSIYSLALSVTMLVAGFKAVTRGVIAAGSEVALAVVAYVVLIVLTVTSGFGNAGLSVARVSTDLSAGVASFAAGQERQQECAAAVGPGTDDANQTSGAEPTGSGPAENRTSSACTFGFAIQRSLVELPYQNLQWGQVLDGVAGKEECAAINLALLNEGPWGNADEPRDRMRAVPACEENADFNHEASYIRLGIASANTIAAATVTMLLLAMSAMLLWQQIKLLFLTVTMPHALVFAILPGRARRLAWLWVEHLIGVVIRTVILSLGLVVWLSLFSLIVHEQLTVRGIFLSLFASVAMAISGFYGLYRLGTMTSRINPAAGRRPLTGQPGSPPPPTSGGTGPGGLGGSRGSAGAGAGDGGRQTTARQVTNRAIGGARTIVRSARSSSSSTASERSTIGGGPGDHPGGGAAAPTQWRIPTGPNRTGGQQP